MQPQLNNPYLQQANNYSNQYPQYNSTPYLNMNQTETNLQSNPYGQFAFIQPNQMVQPQYINPNQYQQQQQPQQQQYQYQNQQSQKPKPKPYNPYTNNPFKWYELI